MKYLIKVLLLFVLVKADSTTVEYPSPDKLVVITEEFESYRRVVIMMESSGDTGSQLPEPELIIGNFSETFDIVLNVSDPTIYQGKIRRQVGRFHPIDLQVIEKDSLTLVIHGRVNRFEKIVSYKLLGENQFYFDIYPKLPEQSFAQEASVPGNEKKPPVPSKITSFGIQAKKQTAKLPESVFVLDKSVLIQALLISAVIIIGVVLLSLIVVFLWKKATKTRNKPMRVIQQEPSFSQTEKDENLHHTQLVQNRSINRESLIRKIMGEKKISYDEASMYLDIKGDRLDASA
ncbi:MAG TPA: hypothetical protein ENH49_00910 [Candidatus Marinimicrobia bacterium]|nr:hypothetical protein [Candidatus Neomarinimicrobiota bacterium]